MELEGKSLAPSANSWNPARLLQTNPMHTKCTRQPTGAPTMTQTTTVSLADLITTIYDEYLALYGDKLSLIHI